MRHSCVSKEDIFRLFLSVGKKQMQGTNLSNCHHSVVFISWSHFVEVANIYSCTHLCSHACGLLCSIRCDQVLFSPIDILRREKIIVMLNKNLTYNQ